MRSLLFVWLLMFAWLLMYVWLLMYRCWTYVIGNHLLRGGQCAYIVDKLDSDLQASFLMCDDDNDMGRLPDIKHLHDVSNG